VSDFAIEAAGLVKRFAGAVALAGVDLAVRPGTALALLGPNGSGKTTAVRILSTLLTPDSGTARVCGHDVRREAGRVRELIGLTGQYVALDHDLTGYENLLLVARLREFPRRLARRRVRELLDRFALTGSAARLVRTYSGGMRRRLDLAACLLGRPRVLYLDEPTTGLDPRGRVALWDEVLAMRADGTTVLLTTQYLEEAERLADEVTIIDRGRVVASGLPEMLKAKIGNRTLQIRLEDPAELVLASRIVAAATGGTPRIEADQATLVVAVAGPSITPMLLRRLDHAGIALAELALRLPTLEEVFFALTGSPFGSGFHMPNAEEAQ
jgi:oleandomycin transport system ATP-binding protein